MLRSILHCDMNNFYASVECMLDPALKKYPIAVCGSVEERHGIVLAKNYKAKAFDGSLKDFNKEGKDVTSIDVNDERTAEILKKACKKSHIPVDMREVTRADGSVTHTAFCEVKSIDQVASLLKMASEQVLEEQKEMTKTLVLYDEHDQAIISADFVNNGEINMDEVEKMADKSVRFEIKDHKDEVLESGSIAPNAKEEIKEAARKHNPKKDKTLSERIKDKKEQSQKKQKDKNRQREKTKKKSWDTSL